MKRISEWLTARFGSDGKVPMPTLFRLVRVLSLIGAVVFAAAYALVTYVQPVRRPMVTSVPVTLSETQWPTTHN